MIWLFMAIWISRDYKVVAKLGPFEDYKTCYSVGALSANEIQSKDEVTNALGACVKETPITHSVSEPKFLDYKGMWGMVCASTNQDDLCWLKDGHFTDPLSTAPTVP